MTAWVIEDDCLPTTVRGKLHLTIKYKGPNPFRVYHQTKRLMRDIWEVESKDFWEREFRWDKSGDPCGFFVKAYVVKGLDQFSKVIAETIIEGAQPSDPNAEGWVNISMGGVVKSTFGGKGILQDARNPIYRLLVWLYHYFMYSDQRRHYLEEWCRNKLYILRRSYQEILGMRPVVEA